MSPKDPYEKFMDRPLGTVQGDLALLDLIKGLEAYASIACVGVMAEYEEFRDVDVPEGSDIEVSVTGEQFFIDGKGGEQKLEPIDDLHHFARECRKAAKGLRQQLEQRMFGGVRN
jgi:hypothetical protein